jgi:hypothetical protein
MRSRGQPVQSRPRVARAIEAARLAQAGIVSAPRLASAGRHLAAVERAPEGLIAQAVRRAERGLAPQLVLAAARAAREAGRQPEEIWAEALHDWLALREERSITRLPTTDARRQSVWHDIEDTMQVLRAS